MPTVAVIFGLTAMLFYEDHDPAHFHVRGPGFSAKVMLADLSLASVRGELRSRDVRRIRNGRFAIALSCGTIGCVPVVTSRW